MSRHEFKRAMDSRRPVPCRMAREPLEPPEYIPANRGLLSRLLGQCHNPAQVVQRQQREETEHLNSIARNLCRELLEEKDQRELLVNQLSQTRGDLREQVRKYNELEAHTQQQARVHEREQERARKRFLILQEQNGKLHQQVMELRGQVDTAKVARRDAETRAEELDRTNRRRGNGGLIFDFDHWSPGSIYEASRADWGEGLPRNALEEGSMAWEASEPLGAGAFGSVVKVRRDGQSYALKRILPHSRLGDRAARREMLVLRRCGHHDNIIKAFAMDDRSPHMPFLMEMAGSDLFDALYDDNQLGATAADMIRFTSEAANGLGHVHRHAIVHCDVKPENILLRQEGGRVIAKVADFGSAVGYVESRPMMTGTLGYIPHENFHDVIPALPCQDVLSLGVVAAQVLLVPERRTSKIFFHDNILTPEEIGYWHGLGNSTDKYAYEKEVTYHKMFNMGLLSERLIMAGNLLPYLPRKTEVCEFLMNVLRPDYWERSTMGAICTQMANFAAEVEAAGASAATTPPLPDADL